MGAIAYALQLLAALPPLIEAGINIKNTIEEATSALGKMQTEKRDPTVEEWNALNNQIVVLRARLHAGPGS